jgi:hypothetical protein
VRGQATAQARRQTQAAATVLTREHIQRLADTVAVPAAKKPRKR